MSLTTVLESVQAEKQNTLKNSSVGKAGLDLENFGLESDKAQ